MANRRRGNAGFTLIELMIVVAIIGILAAIAIPGYRNFVAKAQFSEAFNLLDGVKTAVADAYRQKQTLKGLDNGKESIPLATDVKGNYVSRVDVAKGVITAHFSKASMLSGKTATLTPTLHAGSLTWQCTTTVDRARAPSPCR